MAALDSVISVQITSQTTAVAQASFSIPLIVGATSNGWSSTDYVHSYTSPASMLTDGYISSSPEYVAALAMYSQPINPTQFLVGKRGSAVAQVDTFGSIASVPTGHAYSISVNGTPYTYTSLVSDTQVIVLNALSALIVAAQPVTGAVTSTGSTAILTLTGTTPGLAVTYSAIDAAITRVAITPASGISTDLANIRAQSDAWYGVAITGATDAEILQAAAYIEGQKKIHIAVSATTAISGASTTDVGSALKAAAYKRTALVYSPANASIGIGAAWLGSQLPLTPGASMWAFKTLSGMAADTLTDTQAATCIGVPVSGTAGKNVNIYRTLGGVNVTEMGITAGGQYLDITVGNDWLQSTLQANIYAALVNSQKVPYTDAGTSVLISAVKSAIDQGVANGLIDGGSAITISAPPVLSVSANQRANRIAPTISFSCRLQGAYQAVTVQGTVSV